MQKSNYKRLVAKRKKCQACEGLCNPAAIESGIYDSNQIGPWTRWQDTLSPKLMIVGQDWGDVNYFTRHQGIDGDDNRTNVTLSKLLASIGIPVGLPSAGPGSSPVFFTNAILCVKQGGLQAKVETSWFQTCQTFLRQQVEIVNPKIVVTLGAQALRATRDAFGLPHRLLRESVADRQGETLVNGSRLMAVYHCGARVLNTHRPFSEQLKDWKRVRRTLQRR